MERGTSRRVFVARFLSVRANHALDERRVPSITTSATLLLLLLLPLFRRRATTVFARLSPAKLESACFRFAWQRRGRDRRRRSIRDAAGPARLAFTCFREALSKAITKLLAVPRSDVSLARSSCVSIGAA